MARGRASSATGHGSVDRPHLAIIGLMGVGKSTAGSLLAEELGRRFVDSDVDIERLTGSTGADFAAEHGVRALHQLEAAVLIGALKGDDPSVVTAASSTVEDELVRLLLPQRAWVIRIRLPLTDTIARQATGTHRRPMSIEELTELAERREPYFEELADLTVDGRHTTSQIVSDVVSWLA